MEPFGHHLTLTFCSHVFLSVSSALFSFVKNAQWAHPGYLRPSPQFQVSCSAAVIPSTTVIPFAVESNVFIDIREKSVDVFGRREALVCLPQIGGLFLDFVSHLGLDLGLVIFAPLWLATAYKTVCVHSMTALGKALPLRCSRTQLSEHNLPAH